MTETLNDQSNRGADARRILDDPMLNEIIEKMKRDLFEQWAANADPDKQREIWNVMAVLKGIRQRLQNCVDNGLIADKAIEKRNA